MHATNDGKEIEDNACIVEFQAFKGNQNEFIIKELVIYDLYSDVSNYFLFKPPYTFSNLTPKSARTNKWLSNNYHYISWNEGFTNYKELENIIYLYCDKYKTIYTTGEEKRKFISMYTSSDVVNFKTNKTHNASFSRLCVGVKNTNHKFSKCALIHTYNLVVSLKYHNNQMLEVTSEGCDLRRRNEKRGNCINIPGNRGCPTDTTDLD